ncbi:hypothetical protein CROQUDRAFT_535348 [Cronartium quercuum f. sp. fusiforme G11]|uniref:Uncharacterized protein n=1 Tax=Cronartium quercuum f. sp. fusiforme G11 TaxID=708437 RepID=A0A9P6NM87_9BASI|nr:hypothetical protein CROQUDRAFT_535348 [Cronartium quercuum f. sp. fusiforme G11]
MPKNHRDCQGHMISLYCKLTILILMLTLYYKISIFTHNLISFAKLFWRFGMRRVVMKGLIHDFCTLTSLTTSIESISRYSTNK